MNPGLTTFLVSASTVTFLSFALMLYERRKKKFALVEIERKLREKILSSSEASWKKVGSVKDIIFYPLKSGKGKSVKQCNFEECGISIDENGVFTIKDRMFIVYDENTGKFQTGRQYAKLLLVNISPVDSYKAKLESVEMMPLVFNLPNIGDKNVKVSNCTMWWNEPIKCLDCGPEVGTWISKLLLGSDSGLKLGFCVPECPRIITKGAWENYAATYNLRNEDVGIFADLASYMVLSEASVDDLNQRLEKPVQPLQLRPNILVEGNCEPYAEDGWEWIKVGNNAIIRNVKPCTRCSMVRIDPDTGIPHPQFEPLQTLRTYRKLTDAELDKLEHHSPALGIYCGLYQTGDVQVPGTNIVIDKGTVVYITLKGIHEDPEYHPDPLKFDPKRFSEARKQDIKPCTYMPFGDGPKICMRTGMLLTMTGLITILREYEVLLNPSSRNEISK